MHDVACEFAHAAVRSKDAQKQLARTSLSLCTYQCYARGGGPWDRVGTLIRKENLESNFLTLGIRFQFKVPHLGEGFKFNISHETENFKPSDHEVKNMCLDLTRLSMIVLLQ